MLVSNLGDLLEGELLYAKDEDKLYMVEGGALVALAPLDDEHLGASLRERPEIARNRCPESDSRHGIRTKDGFR